MANITNISEFIETTQGARIMLNKANALNDIRFFITMVTKQFRKPSLQAMFGSELAPIIQISDNLGEVKKSEMTSEDYKHWFSATVSRAVEALKALEKALEATDEEAWDAAFTKATTSRGPRTPSLAYVTLGDSQVLLADAVEAFLKDVNLVTVILNGTDLNDAVASWATENEVGDDHATAILRQVGSLFKQCEKNVRYRAERSDKGEPKAAEKAKK